MVANPGFIDLITWPIGFSSLIGCSFILEEAVNPESAKDSVRYQAGVIGAVRTLTVLVEFRAMISSREEWERMASS